MLLQQILNKLLGSGIYALYAVGFTVIFGIMGVLNMAHADVGMAAAMAVVWAVMMGLGPIEAVALSLAVTALIAVVIERCAIRPAQRFKSDAAIEMPLIATIGIGMILENLAALLLGNRGLPFPFQRSAFLNIGGFLLSEGLLISAGIAFVLLLALELLVTRTGFGRQVRAVAQNRNAARIMGIDPEFTVLITVILTSGLAGIAGCLAGVSYGIVAPYMGIPYAIKGLVAMIVGGIGSLRGAVLGAMLIGVVEAVAVTYFGSQSRDVWVFVILMIVLALKPTGLVKAQGVA